MGDGRGYTPCLQSGAVAQLGERLNGIQEVEGSTPFGSTIFLIPFPLRVGLRNPAAEPTMTLAGFP